MVAWRIYKQDHARTAFTGKGASLYGGRFNSKGFAVIYAAESIALASLEMLVHLQAEEVMHSYRLRPIQFERQLVEVLELRSLPRNWRSFAMTDAVRALGDDWIQSKRSPILQVPSAVVPDEFNFLLNPNHPDFGRVRIGRSRTHRFDPRLLK